MDAIKLALWVFPPYLQDAILMDPNPADPDGRLAPIRALAARVRELGGECHTQDIFLRAGQVPDIVLFLDIPPTPVDVLLSHWKGKVRRFVILQEPEPIIPRNWDRSFHSQFEKIFTWSDTLADGEKYVKFYNANVLPVSVPRHPTVGRKLCTLIARNYKSRHPLELYSKRIEGIRWFETNHPEEFDLYGKAWDEYIFQGPKLVRALNRLRPLKRLLSPKYPSYRGPIKKKLEVLSQYRFSICYENNSGMPGYISEKIFDCFAAGCLPVYWGAPNIASHIPEECFLDKRNFPGYQELYERMRDMTDAEYFSRIRAIELFLLGSKGKLFSVDNYVETILSGMTPKT